MKEKPKMEKYGYHVSNGIGDEPTGWMLEGGEEEYYKALKEWEEIKLKDYKPIAGEHIGLIADLGNKLYTITYQVTETRIVELTRVPTQEEIDLILNTCKCEGEAMYDTEGLIDWESEHVIDTSHNWVKLFHEKRELKC